MSYHYDDGAPHTAEILIVDDQVEITAMVTEFLVEEGFQVRVAHDGAMALNELMTRKPDLLLLDVAMPVMTGEQVLRWLRQQSLLDLPVILMTADQHPERYWALGARRILQKPFDLSQLLRLIKGSLGPVHGAQQRGPD